MPGEKRKAATAAYGVFDRAWTAACWPLIGVLNILFKPDPQTGKVSRLRIALWLTTNETVLYLAVMHLSAHVLFWSLIAFLLVHILIMASSLRIKYEVKRIMEGALKPEAMTFSAFDAVNNLPILVSSVFFYIIGPTALIEALERNG